MFFENAKISFFHKYTKTCENHSFASLRLCEINISREGAKVQSGYSLLIAEIKTKAHCKSMVTPQKRAKIFVVIV